MYRNQDVHKETAGVHDGLARRVLGAEWLKNYHMGQGEAFLRFFQFSEPSSAEACSTRQSSCKGNVGPSMKAGERHFIRESPDWSARDISFGAQTEGSLGADDCHQAESDDAGLTLNLTAKLEALQTLNFLLAQPLCVGQGSDSRQPWRSD